MYLQILRGLPRIGVTGCIDSDPDAVYTMWLPSVNRK